jgi:hypothetical protein
MEFPKLLPTEGSLTRRPFDKKSIVEHANQYHGRSGAEHSATSVCTHGKVYSCLTDRAVSRMRRVRERVLVGLAAPARSCSIRP